MTGVSTLTSLALPPRRRRAALTPCSPCWMRDAARCSPPAGAAGALTAALGARDRAAALPVLAPAAVAPADLGASSGGLGRRLAVGDGAIEYREILEAAGIVVADPDSPLHRVDAATHARLAAAGLSVSGDAVRPEYLRVPDAELTIQAAAR